MLSASLFVFLAALPGLVSAAPSRKRTSCKAKPSLNGTQSLAAGPQNGTLPQNITADALINSNNTWTLNATYFGANVNDSDWKIYSEDFLALMANQTASTNLTVPVPTTTSAAASASSAAVSPSSAVAFSDPISSAAVSSEAPATITAVSSETPAATITAGNLLAPIASASPSATSSSLSADQQAWLDAHNSARAQYGAAPVVWSNEAAEASQANFESNKQTCKLVHTKTGFGQNLAGGWGSAGSVKQSVDMWMAEASVYDPANPTSSAKGTALHFTAMVWKSTTSIGCYLGTCDNDSWYAACSYGPAGNVIGAFADNVGSKTA